MSSSLRKCIQDFLATVLVSTSHPFAGRFRCVRFLAVWKSNKYANRETSSWNQAVRFTWRVLLMCVRFNSRGKRVATSSSRCSLTSLYHHTYVQCVCFFEHRWEKTGMKLVKKRRPRFVKYLPATFSVGWPAKINNTVTASQCMNSTIPCHWTFFHQKWQ